MNLWIDCETTGLDPAHHEIIEVAVLDARALVLHRRVYPCHAGRATAEALAVNGYSLARWEAAGAVSSWEGARAVAATLEGQVVWAHKVAFDASMLLAWAARCKLPLAVAGWGCTRQAARALLPDLGTATDRASSSHVAAWSLANVARALALEPEPPEHRALAGATLCRAVYERLCERFGAACVETAGRMVWRDGAMGAAT